MKMTVIRSLSFLLQYLLFSLHSIAQQPVSSFSIEVANNKENALKTFPIANEINQKVCLVVKNKNSLQAYLLQSDMQLEAQLMLKNVPTLTEFWDNLVGSFYNNNTYVIVGQEDRLSKHFSFIEINFDKKSITYHERWKLSFSNEEEILGAFSEKGVFYALAVFKNAPAIRLYELNKPFGVPVMHVFNLPETEAISKSYKNLHQYLAKNEPQLNPFQKVPTDISGNSLAASVPRHKIYIRPDSLILSIDKVGDATHLLILDLKNTSCNYQKVAFLEPACNENNSTQDWNYSNSFLLHQYLFQINSCKVRTQVGIMDWQQHKILKTFQFDGNDSIAFRNSAFLIKKQGALSILDATSSPAAPYRPISLQSQHL